ncbi:hypothetical protein A3B48_01710 [Candidatus Gottesmanbacteria bacterium RIFCSPLOWO2_01_FULL_40_10]|nr:MAG: hypothetical protein A3B48_01710 [Candidatus Gottesmanbacteria bacterium RIFCSPLOWO2_01_FULL_40_10]
MKKDVVLALLVGFVIGASIAVTAVKLPAVLDKASKASNSLSDKTEPTPTVFIAESKSQLEITSPTDLSIQTENKVSLTGKAKPASVIILETSDYSDIFETDADGSFSASINLEEGGNPVYLTTVDLSGNQETKSVTLFYTTEKL